MVGVAVLSCSLQWVKSYNRRKIAKVSCFCNMWSSNLNSEPCRSFCLAVSLWPPLCLVSDWIWRNLNSNNHFFPLLFYSWLNSTVFSRAEETFFLFQNREIDKILIQCLTSLLNWSVYQFTAVRKVYSPAAWNSSAFPGTLKSRVCFLLSIKRWVLRSMLHFTFIPQIWKHSSAIMLCTWTRPANIWMS